MQGRNAVSPGTKRTTVAWTSTYSCTSARRTTVAWLVSSLAATWLAAVSGCTREYYRKDADQEAAYLIQEKQNDPRWRIPDYSVYGDSRSRFYDPNDPDCPPIPPDDPASHELMHCVYGMKGSKKWHENGDLTELENPGWQQYLSEFREKTEDGHYIIDLQNAVQLALMNSPRYQSNIESLYLSAIDVAFERFRFDVQFFAGNRTTWTHLGNENSRAPFGGTPPTRQSSSELTTANSFQASGPRTSLGAGKLFPSGGQFLVDFANTFVWQFAGSDQNTRADSLLSFTFLQPLLRQGGREVAMEQLTLAERGLLANVRQMERYRQSFLLDVAVGTGAGQGPSRQGGFLGGAGLSGFTGTGTGGFAGVGEGQGFGRLGGAGGGGGGGAGGAAGAGFAGGVAGNVSGFIGLAQRAQQIRNREANLSLQTENLARMEALAAAGRMGPYQVDQFRQNVQTTRSQYLAANNDYQQQLENFLINTLGLPPDFPVRIDQSIVEPFQFTDQELTNLRTAVRALTDRVRSDEDPSLETVQKALEEFMAFREPVAKQFESVRGDFRGLDAAQGQRLDALEEESDRKAFLAHVDELKQQFKSLEVQFKQIQDDTSKVRKQVTPQERKAAFKELERISEALSELLLELGFNQAGARLEAIVLQPVRLDSDQAFRLARANRLDIMNQRAEVVDQWRLITFNADRLEADLNIELNGAIGTLDRNIVKFRDQTGSFSAAVRFDSPITRLGERNLYRQALIDYQRVRRNYIQFEDQVNQGLRGTLRGIELLEEEIELRRQAMRIAIRQMDFNQARLKEPPRVGAAADREGDPVRDLLGAFSDYLQTQTDVMNTYLNYQQLRMVLYRDLGIVRFDEKGMWVDEPLEAALKRLAEEGEPFIPPPAPTLAPAVAESGDADNANPADHKDLPVVLMSGIAPSSGLDPVRRTAANLAPSLVLLSNEKARLLSPTGDGNLPGLPEPLLPDLDNRSCF